MARFHINPKSGEPGQCKASKANCPFGGEDKHYPTSELARRAFENSQEATQNEFYQWAMKISTYSPTAESARAFEPVRWAADRYWSEPQAHRRHLLKFAQKIQGRCIYCGSLGDSRNKVSLNEHLIPADRGGITVVGNIGPSCAACNTSKGNQEAKEYFAKKLKDPDFRHPIFNRSQYEFDNFLNSYQRPFKDKYPEEWELAQKVLTGEGSAKDELVGGAKDRYEDWRESVFPPPSDYMSSEERRDWEREFAIRHARGEFTTREPSLFEKLQDSDDPLDKKIVVIANRKAASSAKTASSQAKGFVTATQAAREWLSLYPNNKPPVEHIVKKYSELNSSSQKEGYRFIFQELGYSYLPNKEKSAE